MVSPGSKARVVHDFSKSGEQRMPLHRAYRHDIVLQVPKKKPSSGSIATTERNYYRLSRWRIPSRLRIHKRGLCNKDSQLSGTSRTFSMTSDGYITVLYSWRPR